jgi:hypothetical protein
MNNLARVLSTFFIWAAFAWVAHSAAYSGQMGSFDTVLVVLVAGIATAAGTRFVWGGAEAARQEQQIPAEKAKRTSRDRLVRLINAMDDDEAAELLTDLRTRLMSPGSDGEITALEDLLGERVANRRDR